MQGESQCRGNPADSIRRFVKLTDNVVSILSGCSSRALQICLYGALLLVPARCANAPVNVVLWFDTEDFINPETDDAALRIANDLKNLGVHATFKVVGEKARVLELRKRTDVIRALRWHTVGYHSNWHSIQPVPALYLETFGLLEGAFEFERRERQGVADVKRIFGVDPVCYGQPGSSWGPQSNLALRRMGIPVYLDEGTQIGLNDQPFWYSGLLYVFNMGENLLRPDLNDENKNPDIYAKLKAAAARLSAIGGGTISTYYHPNEYVEREFWDAVNFSHGVSRNRAEWKPPRMRTHEDSERCYRVLRDYVKFMQSIPGVRWVTAKDLLTIYRGPEPPVIARQTAAEHLRKHITFLSIKQGDLSAAELLCQLFGLKTTYVDGPSTRGRSTFKSDIISADLYDQASQDFISFVRANHRLPAEIFIGSETLSLADFAATAAAHTLDAGPIHVQRGKLECEKYVSSDPVRSFNWVIHPDGFSAPQLLELARLQSWTLKPARLRQLQ